MDGCEHFSSDYLCVYCGNDRKRGRGADEEISEFTPLSKRINNLHINNGLTALRDTQQNPPENIEVEWSNGHFVPSPNHSEPSQGSSSCDGSRSSGINFPEYRPELDASHNPYYYENNKLLYSLYVERMQRHVNYS